MTEQQQVEIATDILADCPEDVVNVVLSDGAVFVEFTRVLTAQEVADLRERLKMRGIS